LGTALVSTAAAVVVALSLIPLVYLLIRSSEKSASEITGLLFRTKTFEVLATTSLLVVMVILLTGFFGVLIAAGLHFLELPKKAWLIIPAVLPLAIPSYVFTYTWIAFVPAFTGFFAALFILFLTTLPYVILACLAGLTRVDASQIEVARSLGFSYPKTFFKVVLPQIRTHLSGGLLLAGLYTMSDFGAVSLLNVDTLTVTIQNMYRASYDRTAAAVISLVLITLSAIFVVADEKVRSKQQKGEVIKSTSIKSALIDKKSSKVVTVLLIAAYALFAVFIPIYVLLSRFFSNTVDISWQILLQASLSTITVALLGAGIALILSIPLGILLSERSTFFSRVSSRVILIGHALPGVVIGLALVSFGSKLVPLYQSTFLLAFAYALLFLAKSVASMRASIKQVPTGAKEVAATLGLNKWLVLKNVVTPIAAPGIALGAVLVFLTAMKELPATLMLRPTGFETLATQIWSYAAINRFNEAAPYALILILIAAIPTFILSRPDRSDRGRINSGLGN
jgi:iron(III) transport system permease protein